MACAGNHQLWASVRCRKIYFNSASFESVLIFFSRASPFGQERKFSGSQNCFLVSCRMLLKLQTCFTRSTMLLETNEDKLSAPGVAFEDVQFGLQVRYCVFKENARRGLLPCGR